MKDEKEEELPDIISRNIFKIVLVACLLYAIPVFLVILN
jgi:hypothetical protein